jgi:hypothetical protein
MTGVGKLFLILGLTAIGGVLAIGGGAWYWWRHHSAEFLEAGRAAIEDGRKSGASLEEGGCVIHAVERHKGERSMTSAIRNSVWLNGCLDTSKPQQGFCDGVPSQDNPISVGVWAANTCVQYGVADPYCHTLFQEVSKYCSSPARAGKTRNGPPPVPMTWSTAKGGSRMAKGTRHCAGSVILVTIRGGTECHA